MRQSKLIKIFLTLMLILGLFSCANKNNELDENNKETGLKAATECGKLKSGQYLDKGQSVSSCDGKTILIHQNDGNVVQYDQYGWLWQTGTSGKTTTRFIMQTDGNLVLYNGSTPLWSSGTYNNSNSWLAVQGDCNLVIYNGSGSPIWATYKFCRALPSGNYTLKAAHSLKCADVASFSTADGGNIQQWSCSGANNQKWNFSDLGNGYFKITSIHSGKCMDLQSFSTANGGNIQQWACSGGNNQQWAIYPTGENKYRIVSRYSAKVVEVGGVSTADGANIQQWDYVSGGNQRWFLTRINSLPSIPAQANVFHLTQYYDPTYNADGPSGSWNCGPTSLAMDLRAKNRMPSGLTQNQMIRYMRALISGTEYYITVNGTQIPQSRTGESGFTLIGSDSSQIQSAIRTMGGTTRLIYSKTELDNALNNGYPVILSGYTDQDWRNQFPYPSGCRYGSGVIGHWNTVLGKTASGNYLMDDPMYTCGSVEMTWDQLARFPQSMTGVELGITVEFN